MSAQETACSLKPFGVFVGGAGVVWHRSEEEAKAQAARLESMGFDVIVALHPDIAKAKPADTYAGVRCICVQTECRAGPGCPHYGAHCKTHIDSVATAGAAQQAPGPWRVVQGGKEAAATLPGGFYVHRLMPHEGVEWMRNGNGQIARFHSEHSAAVAKAMGGVQS